MRLAKYKTKCLENHAEVTMAQKDLISVSKVFHSEITSVSGNESLSATAVVAAGELGSGLLSVGKWLGGKTINTFSSVLSGAGRALMKAFTDNATLLSKLKSSIGDEKEVNYSAAAISTLTASGDSSDIREDMQEVLKVLESFKQHQKDVLNYLNKRLIIANKLKSSKDTNSVLNVVEEFNNLEYPEYKLPKKIDGGYESEVLPGGRTLSFTIKGDKPQYLMNTRDVSGSGNTVTYSKSEYVELLDTLNKCNSIYKDLKSSYDGYLSFINNWAKMVKEVSGSLDKSQGLTSSVLGEADKILAGDDITLSFYSRFTPKVVGYTDRYIQVALSQLS